MSMAAAMSMSMAMSMNMGPAAPAAMAYGGMPVNPVYNGMAMGGGQTAQTFLPAYAVGGETNFEVAASPVPL